MLSNLNPFFIYTPTASASIALAVILFTLTSFHVALLVYTKRLYAIPFIIGGAAEVVGYISRTVSCYDLQNYPAYVSSSIMVLVGPAVLRFAIHYFLGEVIAASDFTRYSIFRPILIINMLCWPDLLGLFAQLWGRIKLLHPDDDSEARWSANIICVGLGIQLVVTIAFFVFAGVYHSRLRKHNVISLTKPRLRFSLSMATLYLTIVLTFVRAIFRLIQYAQLDLGFVSQHEWPVFAFDAGPMALVLAVGILWYGVDTDLPDQRNTERELDVPLDRLNSVTQTEALQMKDAFRGRIGSKTVITV
ncbi:RTA1-like protein 1 [Elsinoe fawcettii]|nr:RTA1-like protein 1 [Elsinoe fawcettii]